jgi:hypothetical protein
MKRSQKTICDADPETARGARRSLPDDEASGMKDLMGLMKQAQAMQAKMQAMQAELEAQEVEGASGGGLVKVVATAKGAVRSIAIDDSLMKLDEKDILEDLLVTALEDARKKAERMVEEKMKSMTAGLPLPPGMKLPF